MTAVSVTDWPIEAPRVIGQFGALASESSYDAAVAAHPTVEATPSMPMPQGRSPGRRMPPPTVEKSVWRMAQRFIDVAVASIAGRTGPQCLRPHMSDTAYQEFCAVRRTLLQDSDRPGWAKLSSVRATTPDKIELVAVLKGARRDRALAVVQERRGGEWWCTRFLLV